MFPNFHWIISHFGIRANVDFKLGVFLVTLKSESQRLKLNQNIEIWQIHISQIPQLFRKFNHNLKRISGINGCTLLIYSLLNLTVKVCVTSWMTMNRKTNANSIGERRGTVGGSRGSRPNHRQDSENEEMDESGLSDEDDEQVIF